MFNIRDFLTGILLFPIISTFLIGIFFAYGGFNFVEIDFHKSYEANYDKCTHDYDVLLDDFKELKQDRQVVCEAKECSLSLWLSFWSFIVGGLAIGYLILVGYPWAKERLEKKQKTRTKKIS